MSEIGIVEVGSKPGVVVRDNGAERPLPALWLRSRNNDPSERDAVTGQRLVNPHLLPDNLEITEARFDGDALHLAFSDGFRSRFNPRELLDDVVLHDGCPAPQPWRADPGPSPLYEWNALGQDAVLYQALNDFIRLGFIKIHGTPTEADSILGIARRFGFVRDTNFGPFFEVYTRPGSNDLAYRSVALAPHTDNPYRTPVPGIQLLHCLQNETSGGWSTLADSLAVALQMKREDPEGFALLSRVPVRFAWRDVDSWMVAVKPIVELDGHGEMAGVHYSPRLDDLPLMPDAETRHYHRARNRLGTLLQDPQYEMRFKLDPGELIMFDNNRVLHGRTAFDPSEGHRQLQGCYIDRDGPRSLYRVLGRRLAQAAHEFR